MRRLLAVVALLFTTVVSAEEFYAGANLVAIKYKEDGIPTVNPIAASFKLGKEFNPNFALEGRIGLGVADDTVRVLGVDIAVDLDNYYGVYAKGMLPTGTKFKPYGLVGYTYGKISGTGNGITISGDDHDFSYGIGADVALTKTLGLNFEFARLFAGDGFKVDGFSGGVTFKF